MEILILSGLAYLGFELSKDGKVPRRTLNDTKTLERRNKYPISDDVHPPIHNNMTPFFTSAKSQNTNEEYKQRSLETFTGTDNCAFQSKRECETLFRPEENLTNIHGTQLSLDDNNRKARYSNNITDMMNNVSPIEKQYVGPGLNAGTDVMSKGGFHDMYRILPNNVNSYKKNTFTGRINTGQGVTAKRGALPTINDNQKPERYYTSSDVPMSQQTGPANAPSVRSTTLIQNTQRGSCNPAVGIAAPASTSDASTMHVQNITRNYDSTKCASFGNPSMPGHGAGAYTTTSVLVSDGQREQCTDNAVNVQNVNSGASVYYTDGAAVTQRGTNNNYDGHVHNSSVIASQNKQGYVADPTFREQSSTSYSGNPNQTSGQTIRQYQANATMRGSSINDYNGPAGSIHKASSRYDTAQNACTYKQREEMGRDYTPGGGNMNLQTDAKEIHPNMIVKDDCNNEKYIAPVKGPNVVSFGELRGQTEISAKIPVHNNRLDLGIAEHQLSSNSIAHNINQSN